MKRRGRLRVVPTQPPVRIGARGSKLSLAQSGMVQRRIAAALGADPDDPKAVEAVAQSQSDMLKVFGDMNKVVKQLEQQVASLGTSVKENAASRISAIYPGALFHSAKMARMAAAP